MAERPEWTPAKVGRSGPWKDRVKFGPGGFPTYRPHRILIPTKALLRGIPLSAALGEHAGHVEELISRIDEATEEAQARAAALAGGEADDTSAESEAGRDERSKDEGPPVELVVGGAFILLRGVPDPLAAVKALGRLDIHAQLDNALFANGCCCCSRGGCPPHPSEPGAIEAYLADPFYANPFYANPFYANPFYANPAGGCGCCGSGGTAANPFYANPFYANPFYANPFYANPFYANAEWNPGVPWANASGRRKTSARPATPPAQTAGGSHGQVRVAVVDTGYATRPIHPGGIMAGANLSGHNWRDVPTDDGDRYYDPASGHGTFIAGVIEQIAPGCNLQIVDVLSTYGDGSESTIASALVGLALQSDVDFANLSFSGYTPFGMPALAYAVSFLQSTGTVVVASAGNDATCVPPYPAVLPGVVGVGALDEDYNPAKFTNYGPWVRASTKGVDIVSAFFDWQGAEHDFNGGAKWSGTSFSAPRVVARLARRIVSNGETAQEAVVKLIDDPGNQRLPMLGTIVP